MNIEDINFEPRRGFAIFTNGLPVVFALGSYRKQAALLAEIRKRLPVAVNDPRNINAPLTGDCSSAPAVCLCKASDAGAQAMPFVCRRFLTFVSGTL